MGNTLNGLALTVIAQESLPVLQKYTPAFNLFSTDLSAEVATVGSAISTRIPTAMSALDYARATGYDANPSTSSAVTVTLNKHKHYTVGYDDSEVGNIGLAKLQATFIQPAIYAIVNQVQSDLYALIDTSYPAVYSASYANFGFGGIVTAQKVLDNSGSNSPRSIVMGTNLYYDVLDDIKANSVIGSTVPIRAGEVGQLAGVNVLMSPCTTFAGTGLAGFCAGKDALAMAARVPNVVNEAAGVQVANVTDPNSGFTIQLRQWYSPDRGMWMISAVAIYGVIKGNTSSGVRIITTD